MGSNYRNIIGCIIVIFYLCLFSVITNVSAGDKEDAVNTEAELVWSEFDGEDYEIFYSNLSNNKWASKVQITNNNSTDLNPSISSGANGITRVVWSAMSGVKTNLFYSNFDGSSWTPPTQIITNLSSNTTPSIIIDNENIPWVVWTGFDGQDDDIWFTRWNGDDWDEPQRVNKDDSMPDILPIIGIDEEGNPWVKWSGYDGERYINYSCKWTGTEWGDEKGAERNKSYNSMIKNEVDSIPELPDFLDDSDKASIHIAGGGQIQSIPLRYLTNNSKLSEDSTVDPKTNDEYSKQESSPTIIIGFGDSITQGVPYITEHGDGRRVGGYEPKLEVLLSNIYVLNYGVGSEITSEGVNRIDDVLSQNSAKSILILEGTNDWGYYSYKTTISNLEIMIDKSIAKLVIPVIATITPDSRDSQEDKDILKACNSEIMALATRKAISLCDQYSAVIDNWSSLTDDGVHPNDDGYQVMAQTWYNTILGNSGGGGGGGCFIATAAFGSSLEPHVMILKDFRDQYLLTNRWGGEFVKIYYKISPQIADIIADYKSLKLIVRTGLYPLVGYSYVILNSSTGEKIALYLILILICFGVVLMSYRRVKI